MNYRETRYCSFAAPDETVGVIDVSPAGDGSRGIAFLSDRIIVKLGENTQQAYYTDIRIMEILPSYETPFEDELSIGSPSGEIRISDCSLNKFFLRQLISNVSRMSVTMKESDRSALSEQLTAEALNYYAQTLPTKSEPPKQEPNTVPAPKTAEPVPEAAAAVQEIAAAKKAALAVAQPNNSIEITEEKIEWISGKRPKTAELHTPVTAPALNPNEDTHADTHDSDDITDMTHEQTMSYLLDSIAEINSEPVPATTEAAEAPILETEPIPETVPATAPEPVPAATEQPAVEPLSKPEPKPVISPYTIEPDSNDIYIQASRKIRELCEDGRLSMEQVNTAVKEQLVPASELYSSLDVQNAPLPPAVKNRALQLAAASDKLTDYFALGEDIAARVMFFMLYQMLSYTDRIVQSDDTKQRLNYFFVRFGAAGMILSMLDANN